MPHASIRSPIGSIDVVSDGDRLAAIHIGNGSNASAVPEDPILREALAQIAAFLDGRLTVFDLPLAPAATPRGPAHRAAIAAIAHGDTATYGALAHAIGSSPRAVGQACRRNPFPIVIPCHRILGAGGAIGHYSAGAGVDTKRWLLELERRSR